MSSVLTATVGSESWPGTMSHRPKGVDGVGGGLSRVIRRALLEEVGEGWTLKVRKGKEKVRSSWSGRTA